METKVLPLSIFAQPFLIVLQCNVASVNLQLCPQPLSPLPPSPPHSALSRSAHLFSHTLE